MKLSMTKMTRRGRRVNFDVFLTYLPKHGQFKYTYKRGKRGSVVETGRTLSTDPEDTVNYVGVEVTGEWNGTELVLGDVRVWCHHDIELTKAQEKQIHEFIKASDHMKRVTKNLLSATKTMGVVK